MLGQRVLSRRPVQRCMQFEPPVYGAGDTFLVAGKLLHLLPTLFLYVALHDVGGIEVGRPRSRSSKTDTPESPGTGGRGRTRATCGAAGTACSGHRREPAAETQPAASGR